MNYQSVTKIARTYAGLAALAASVVGCQSPMQMSVIGSNRMYAHEPQDVNIVFRTGDNPALVYGTVDAQISAIGSPIQVKTPVSVQVQPYAPAVQGKQQGTNYGPIRLGTPEVLPGQDTVLFLLLLLRQK